MDVPRSLDGNYYHGPNGIRFGACRVQVSQCPTLGVELPFHGGVGSVEVCKQVGRVLCRFTFQVFTARTVESTIQTRRSMQLPPWRCQREDMFSGFIGTFIGSVTVFPLIAGS